MGKLFRKLKNIVIGTWRNVTRKSSKLAERRMAICEICEHKKHLTKAVTYCDLCGCVIKSKSLVKDEKCSLNKW